MTMTATQKADRLALIKKIANRRNKMAKIKANSARTMQNVKDTNIKPKRKSVEVPKETHNIYQWTDASKYAAEYYGETLYHTTKFDNDWD